MRLRDTSGRHVMHVMHVLHVLRVFSCLRPRCSQSLPGARGQDPPLSPHLPCISLLSQEALAEELRHLDTLTELLPAFVQLPLARLRLYIQFVLLTSLSLLSFLLLLLFVPVSPLQCP